jgi:hypothetical protein
LRPVVVVVYDRIGYVGADNIEYSGSDNVGIVGEGAEVLLNSWGLLCRRLLYRMLIWADKRLAGAVVLVWVKGRSLPLLLFQCPVFYASVLCY